MVNEKRLIDANAIQYRTIGCGGWGMPEQVVSDYEIDKMPTVDAVEVVHGRWVSDKADILFHCSECENQISTDWDYDDLTWNYCPNCGAKMDGGRKDDEC